MEFRRQIPSAVYQPGLTKPNYKSVLWDGWKRSVKSIQDEELAYYQNNNKLDNITLKQSQPEEIQAEKPIISGSEIILTKAQILYLKQIKDLVAKTDKAKMKKLLDLELIVQLGDDLILTTLGEMVLARSENL